jgi:FG-GAP repeat protein
MWRRAVGVMFVCWLAAACNQLLGIPDVVQGRHVGGRVHGLWDGADGVALRLMADGVDTLLTVSANSEFRFPPQFAPGASYTVTVVSNPVQHTCIVDGGGNGVVGDAETTSVSIACTGPAMTVAFSGPWAWTFDPTEETQTFAGSVIAQDVALTIGGGGVTSATINGTAATLGQPTAAMALPLGPTSVRIGVTASGGLAKTYELVFQRGTAVIDQMTYGKASNTGMNDEFGFSVSLSGNTLAVAAFGESSGSVGVNGNQADDSAHGAGAVYVFVRTGAIWTQQAYLKASNTDADDSFGQSISLSGDTLAVGAPSESSATTGVNGNQTDNTAGASGAVYVFIRTGTTWTQQAYLKASNTGTGDFFGHSLSLSGDTLAVGAFGEDSAISDNQTDNSAGQAGAVYVFARKSATWTQQAYLKASNTGANDQFGLAVSLSGNTLAVAAPRESGGAVGVDGNQADDSANQAGAVYVFVRTGTTWTQQAYLKASNTSAGDLFGWSVSLSGDTLAVGSVDESSAAVGVNGNQADDSAIGAGAVYVFVRADTTWTQQAYLKASNTGKADGFGWSVALSRDILAVGAIAEGSATTGIDGNQADNSATGAGAIYVFVRTDTTWAQRAYLKASNTGAGDSLGFSVSLSGDTLAIGAATEGGGATGINGNQADNSAARAGAVYVFR